MYIIMAESCIIQILTIGRPILTERNVNTMARKYGRELLEKIIQKQETKIMDGIEVLVKNIPDSDEQGVMDPRLYKESKKQYMMMKVMPKGAFKMDSSPETIKNLRKIFNGTKSVPTAEAAMGIENTTIPGGSGNEIPVRIYRPAGQKGESPLLLYFHGGGFFGGSPDVIEELMKVIVENEAIPVVSVDYRLAPENPYPAGHEDCYESLKWVYENAQKLGVDKQKIVISGDSAGGNLAQYCSLRDKEEKLHMVRGQMLLYPTVNMGGLQDEYSTWSLDRYDMNPKQKNVIEMQVGAMASSQNMLGALLGVSEEMVHSPYLSPYGSDLSGMPPTMITVGEFDGLKVECLAFAVRLNQAGVKTRTILYRGMGHAYGDNVGVYPQSEDCAIEMGQFIQDVCK